MKAKSQTNEEQILENRLRRMADRRGLKLVKSRARDPHALTYGGYHLINLGSDEVVCGSGNVNRNFAASLQEIEDYLMEGNE